MSVVVKGMEMPNECIECPCLREDRDGDFILGQQCGVTLRTFDVMSQEVWGERADDCPLFELKNWREA